MLTITFSQCLRAFYFSYLATMLLFPCPLLSCNLPVPNNHSCIPINCKFSVLDFIARVSLPVPGLFLHHIMSTRSTYILRNIRLRAGEVSSIVKSTFFSSTGQNLDEIRQLVIICNFSSRDCPWPSQALAFTGIYPINSHTLLHIIKLFLNFFKKETTVIVLDKFNNWRDFITHMTYILDTSTFSLLWKFRLILLAGYCEQ